MYHRGHHNINKDMCDLDLIDLDSLDFSDEQTWLYRVPEYSEHKLDIVDWSLSLDWPVYEDDDYQKTEQEIYSMLDQILQNNVHSMPDKHKFDSRTYVKPKKSPYRPSIQNLVEASNPPLSINKYLTYNKYNSNPLGPMLRLKTFSVDANTENCSAAKEYAMKRKSLVQDEDPQLEDMNITLMSDGSERLSSDNKPSKPINIDLSQPAHNIHNTFNKGVMMNDRGSLNMSEQSEESLMRMSPPSLVSSLLMDVSSLLMESSENFHESMESRKSINNRDSGIPMSGRESMDPMLTSMTLSILDEKDMSTSFLSQTTHADHDSFMDSLPPSLVSSANSSFVVSNSTPRARTDSVESNNVFSSATFTHLEQSEKLLSARPRHQMYNSFKKDNPMRSSGSYTKAKEEACQIDNVKILNDNIDKKDTLKTGKATNEMAETITLHYSNRFRRNDAEKENCNSSFEKDEAFYKEMGVQKTVDLGKNSLNVTLDKQELNEIIQARQKLSLARKALPTEPEKPLPNQVEMSPDKCVPHNQTISVPKKSNENASELLARRRAVNGYDKVDRYEDIPREPPKRNATFKKTSLKASSIDTAVVFLKDEKNIIDINSATLNLIDAADKTLQQEEWGSQERAMVGSSESTDTGTFSSSSPPESVPDTGSVNDPRSGTQVASTPLIPRVKDGRSEMLDLHHTISPIYGVAPIDDKSYTVTNLPGARSTDGFNTTINTGTIVKKNPKRDILADKTSPEKKIAIPPKVPSSASYSIMGPPNPAVAVPKKTGLPTSKLRQYSSHRDLSRIPGGSNGHGQNAFGFNARPARSMIRRGVYASNPALSPTSSQPPNVAKLHRTDSYTIAGPVERQTQNEPVSKPVLTNPPVLVRQGTETLRRERPQSQIVQPKELRAASPFTSLPVPVPLRNQFKPTTMRPYSIAGASQLRVSRPTSVPYKATSVPPPQEPRPASGTSGLPRPSRLPAPRRALRPPSVYSVAPAAEADHY